ncbi:molybdopterin-dependent oxidoreductase [Sulfuricurvum sp.]|uniref:molybdopterin-dependent oxidoreductase n=1 Tax=Sulfuricurvum sp. TaxID=2025608 RepID=UPI002627F09F|nr:molybdopterin-dependent oxidoreductase [Sulfuricurvum sp.]MDD2266208.1 molybdopterin-dependent oxidoreductase [Sulfuricurvum sp.]MDD2783142.1 molybdopterin-dependent oxidoreductase [Sulfuricurvum sp.]
MNQTTACPLDCYDACRIHIDENGKIKGDKTHPVTSGYLCPHLNHFAQQDRIQFPRLHGKTVTMEKALETLIDALQKSKPDQLLYYRGSGNIGLMQRVSEHFFASIKAVGTSGSLCDGAGEAGVLLGRGKNEILSPQMIRESEVVVFWGRNPHTTHSHLLPFLEGKKIIVIDPFKTAIAQKADLHIQIKPHCDLHLALLLSRFAVIEGLLDSEFLQNHASEYNDFYELTQTVRIKATLDAIDVTLGQIGAVLELMQGKKTAILVGVGVQKYQNGADVLRAIDGFGAIMGLFGKSGCGVSYVGDSLYGIELPFKSITHRVSKPTVDFSKYNCVFIQGANPLSQMPNSSGVKHLFALAGFSVYFGLYENETSQAADLVIPAKTFLEKDDIRSSYGDYTLQEMCKVTEGTIGLSEYELTRALCDAFGIALESESFYLESLHSQIDYQEGVGYRQKRPDIPYEDGFENGEFEFLDEIDLSVDSSEGFYLITSKYSKGLNSQFKRAEGVYFHPEAGFDEGELVHLSSHAGAVDMIVKYDACLRRDCLMIYSGTVDGNVLTPALLSYEGESAVYQEYKIKVTKKND